MPRKLTRSAALAMKNETARIDKTRLACIGLSFGQMVKVFESRCRRLGESGGAAFLAGSIERNPIAGFGLKLDGRMADESGENPGGVAKNSERRRRGGRSRAGECVAAWRDRLERRARSR